MRTKLWKLALNLTLCAPWLLSDPVQALDKIVITTLLLIAQKPADLAPIPAEDIQSSTTTTLEPIKRSSRPTNTLFEPLPPPKNIKFGSTNQTQSMGNSRPTHLAANTSPTANLNAYIKNIQQQVDHNWTPPDLPSNSLIIKVVIHKNSSNVDTRMTKSSGNRLADQQALMAIQKIKFEPLPTDVHMNKVIVDFNFKSKQLPINLAPVTASRPPSAKDLLLTAPVPVPKKDVDFEPYMTALQERVRRNWAPTNPSANPLTVGFRLHRNGSISDIQITQSSGDLLLDQQSIAAIQQTKFDPLPTGSINDSVKINFNFESHLLQAVPRY